MKKKQIISASLVGKFLFVLFLALTAAVLIRSSGLAADGSGTNTVSPTSTSAGSTGNTFTFTFTAAETMDSGEIKIQTPTGWSTMQGTNGVAGYTTVSSVSGIVADVLNSLDAATSWTVTQHMALSADTGDFQEGTASLANAITATAAQNEQWYFNYGTASNWGGTAIGNLRVGMFLKSSVTTASGDISWQNDDTADLASPLDTVAIPALTADTWTYTSVTLGATTRPTINSYGFRYTNDIGALTLKADSIAPLFNTLDSSAGGKSDGSITRTFLSTAGDFKEGSAAWRCLYAAGAGVGTTGECYFNNTGDTFGPGGTVSFWIRSSVALNAGDFVWIDDNNADFGSPADIVDIPALAANTWTYITLSVPNSSNLIANSYGFRQIVDKGALNLDVDAMGKQIDSGDSTTGWIVPTATVQTLSADSGIFHEGTASIKNIITAGAAAGDTWYQTLGSTGNWSSYTTIGFWIRSTVATLAGDLQFQYSSGSDLTSPIATINIGALSADTWSYQKLTLSGTRTSVNSFAKKYTTDIGGATIYLDDVLIGPGSLTFSGGAAGARILSLSSGQTIIFTYGSGGGSSGVTAPAGIGTATATTTNRVSDSGTLASIGSQPTLTATDAPIPLSIQSFEVSPLSVLIGDSATITFTWSTTGSTATCTVTDPGNSTVASGGTTGSEIVTQPQVTTIYTLTCIDGAESDTATVTVTASSSVNPPSTSGSSAPPVNLGGYGPASAHFYGFVFPSADIQVFTKSSVSGPYTSVPSKKVTIADNGSFEIALEDFLQASYFFAIQAKDKNNNSTALISFAQFAIADVDWTVKDIIIPPTLALNSAVVGIKSPVLLNGYAIPGATINIFIDGKAAGSTKPDTSGYYTFAATSTGLALGSHSIYVKGIFSGKTSDSSLQRTFSLTTEAKSIVDLNGDQSATISDWSIFLSRWRSEDKKTRETIDFNRNGKIDIGDFSIFLNAFQQARNSQ